MNQYIGENSNFDPSDRSNKADATNTAIIFRLNTSSAIAMQIVVVVPIFIRMLWIKIVVYGEMPS